MQQSGIGFIVDALLGYFAYLHSLYTVVELPTNFVFHIKFQLIIAQYKRKLLYIVLYIYIYIYMIFLLL